MHKALALIIAISIVPVALLAQSSTGDIVLIKAGRLIDVRSGRVLTDQAILIEGDRITQVGPTASVQTPANARVIDLSNSTLLPGLIDCHTHLTGEPNQSGYTSLGVSIPRQALYGAKNARVTLE